MDHLDEEIIKCLRHIGIKSLFPIQDKVIPFLTTDQESDGDPISALLGLTGDLIIHAPTGGGKTLSYLLPILQEVLVRKQSGHRNLTAVVVVPTTLLVDQVVDVLSGFKSLLDEDSVFVLKNNKGVVEQEREMFEKHVPSIVIGTFDCVHDHLVYGKLKLFKPSLRYVVFDEADHLVDMHSSLPSLVRYLGNTQEENINDFYRERKSIGGYSSIRKILCSATLYSNSVAVRSLNLQNPKYYSTLEDEECVKVPDSLSLYLLPTSDGIPFWIKEDISNNFDMDQRVLYLLHLLRDFLPVWKKGFDVDGSVLLSKSLYQRLDMSPSFLVFCNTNHECEELLKNIRDIYRVWETKRIEKGTPLKLTSTQYIDTLTNPKTAKRVIENFQKGETKVLLATDSCSRGLDLAVDVVIGFSQPSSVSQMIHRSGRTARKGEQGSAVHLFKADYLESFIYSLQDTAPDMLAILKRYDELAKPSSTSIEAKDY